MLTPNPCPFYLVLPQWHVKDPNHSAQSAGGRLHLNTHTPSTQRNRSGLIAPLSRHTVGTYHGFGLTRNSSRNTRPQSSQLAEPLWTDPGVKSGISARELISTYKKKKKKNVQSGNRRTFRKNPRSEEKAITPSLFLVETKVIFKVTRK